MRALWLALSVAAASSPARADRSTVWSVGVTVDERAIGATYAATGRAEASPLGGARLGLAFEDAPVPMPPSGAAIAQLRLVPELVGGLVADDTHAEGYVGAGLRAELDIASHRRDARQRTAFYVAARALAIGRHQDGAIELVTGGWISAGRDRHRFGWEGGAQIRARADDARDDRELDAVLSIYTSWR